MAIFLTEYCKFKKCAVSFYNWPKVFCLEFFLGCQVHGFIASNFSAMVVIVVAQSVFFFFFIYFVNGIFKEAA